jgi:DNA-directed RNA polymerase specialized sigma24 family protein
VRPWLYGIAIKLLQHHISGKPSDASGRRAGSLRCMSSRPPTRHLAAAVGDLAAIDREILLLIARALDVPVGTVRSRLHRACRRVRETLGKDQ